MYIRLKKLTEIYLVPVMLLFVFSIVWTGCLSNSSSSGGGISSLAEKHFLNSCDLMSKGDLAGARGEIALVLEEKPKHVDALFNLVLIEDMEGNLSERDALIAKIRKIDSSFVDVDAFYGMILLREEKPKKAKAVFVNVLKRDSKSLIALNGLGKTHLKLKEYRSASKIFTEALKYEKENPFLYVDRAAAYVELRKFGEAEKDLTKAISLQPESEFHYLDRARLRLKYFNDEESAMKDFMMAYKRNPKNVLTCYYIAEIHGTQGDFKSSLRFLNEAIAVNSEFYYAYPSLGKINFALGNWEKASKYFMLAYNDFFDDPGYLLFASLSLSKQGKKKEGKDLLAKGIKTLKNKPVFYELYRYYMNPGNSYYVEMAVKKKEKTQGKEAVANHNDIKAAQKGKFYLALMDFHKGEEKAAKAGFEELNDARGAFEFEMARWYIKNIR